ncbi:hypothetical protein [Polyangium sp. 15x6]|uniref:hypothetical protein n=1 Tax=Polyangium sp. 15x6 TaxID=3042687 RepID=UPI00249B5876|nr:hypothetical protein [Polyangium sp. 15x6]MDI3289523.1 hypothetical protein [Polyangium sp. 15x6]
MSEDGFRLPETRVLFSTVERRRRRARAVVRGALAVAVVGAALFPRSGFPLFANLTVAGIAAIVAGDPATRRDPLSPGSISIDARRVVVRAEPSDERSFPLDDVAEGWLEAPGRATLRLRDGTDIVVAVPDDEIGHRLLVAAGVEARARAVRVALASAAQRIPCGEIAGVVGLLCITPIAVVLASSVLITSTKNPRAWQEAPLFEFGMLCASIVFFAVAAALFRFMRGRQVVVGTDGIVFHGFFGRKLVPSTEIESVQRHAFGVLLGLRRGKTLLLPVRARVRGPLPLTPPPAVAYDSNVLELDENIIRREILFRRLEEASLARGQSNAVRLDLEKLDQRDKPFSVWLDEVRRLLAERGGYRESRIVPEDLAVVVEDPAASPERRIGAAIALSQSNDEGTKRRIRIAVKACADLELRAALEEAAHGEIIQARVEKLRQRFRD